MTHFKKALLIVLLSTQMATAADYFLQIKGKPVQGALMIAQTNPEATVKIDNQAVKTDPQGYFMFGFGRFEENDKIINISHNGVQYQTTVPVIARQFRTEKIDGLPPSKVNPPKQRLQRIKREQAQVKQARLVWSEQPHFRQDFIWPTTGRVSGVYGSRRILNGQAKRPHYGMDIANKTGTTVVAPASGIVRMAVTDHYYTGGTIIIDHGYGLNSTYLHLSKVSVKPGQKVKQGQKIGEVGATGRATGPHLDWRINIGAKLRLDPQLIIPPQPAKQTD